MSFLLGDAYASSGSAGESESEEETRKEGRRTKQGGKEQSADEEEEEEEEGEHLPSADDVLATASASDASFRVPRAMRKTKDVEMETFDYLTNKRDQKAEEDDNEEEAVKEEIKQAEQRHSIKRPMPTDKHAGGVSKREKKDAKDRVKTQRERGQAGIGSDFRAWKSETEMAMRQQYD